MGDGPRDWLRRGLRGGGGGRPRGVVCERLVPVRDESEEGGGQVAM
jgi:hypothetical protein